MGYQVVLMADRTLMSECRDIPLLDFVGSVPAERIPRFFFDFLAPPMSRSWVPPRAPYGLRKLEAALLKEYANDVVVINPEYVEKFITADTQVVGIHTMDPLGLGPLSIMFTGGVLTSYSKKLFVELVGKIRELRQQRGLKFRLAVGGQGGWQFEQRPEKIRELGIDNVVIGEIDHIAPDVFKDIIEGNLPEMTFFRQPPDVDEIPSIVRPTLHGMIEVMRGCGRNCEFCDINLRRARHYPPSKVYGEIRVNVESGYDNAWIHSDDVFLYQLEDHKHFMPNADALADLFQGIISEAGATHCNPTHGTVSAAAADPALISRLSSILSAGPDDHIGIQLGMETGSGRLMKQYMPLKAKPFSPEEWPNVVLEGTEVLNRNYWFPAYTLILGLPGEDKDDACETLRLIDTLERRLPERLGNRAHFTVTPMNFVPIGMLKGERFFDAQKINEAQYYVIYRSWRHTLIEINHIPRHILKMNFALKLTFDFILRFGSRAILFYLHLLGKRLGYDHEKALSVAA